MSTRVVDRVDSWSQQSFSDGYAGLHDLSEGDFSGVVRAEGTELYMTRGVAVGIRNGDIDDFEDATGTRYKAESDALPLLAIMQERSEEVRAKYYTEKTSIAEVDETLSNGGFTGYVELSENVLSGDYYLVYHAGKSMSVAYVGEAERLIEGDEAFDTADDEVGIYEVRPVEIDPIEIPEPPEPETTDSPSPASDGDTETGARHAMETADDTGPGSSTPTADDDDDTAADGHQAGDDRTELVEHDTSVSGTGEASSTEGPADTSDVNSGQSPSEAAGSGARTPDESSEQRADSRPTEPAQTTQQSPPVTPQAETDTQPRRNSEIHGRMEPESPDSREADTQTAVVDETVAGSRKEQHGSPTTKTPDLETRSIPSLDPSRTSLPEEGRNASDSDSEPRRQQGEEPGRSAAGTRDRSSSNPPDARGDTQPTGPGAQPAQQEPHHSQQETGEPPETAAASGPRPEELEELESKLAQRDEEIETLETELESAREQRETLESQLEEVRNERDELQAEVTRLEDELNRLETELGAATDADRRITAGEALAGTDLFIRYESKGDATLEKAHDGSVRAEDVNDNLRLEKHTQFESDTVAVGGQTYDEFLEETVSYQFVEWVVRNLLFEIRDTDHTGALQNLYDALPKVDRAELAGVVDVTYVEDGQETRTQESFDVVLRDRMGNPLLVANLNDSLEAATESMMESLITSAERVGQSSDGFACAFLVTTSFFEPGALETASEATQGGLLSRDKRKSFVNLSRKSGYHLCLVEARNENFHLAVPEL